MFINKKCLKHKINEKSFIVSLSLVLILTLSVFSCETTETEFTDEGKVVESTKEEPKEEVFTVQNFFEKLSMVLSNGTVEEALALYENVPEEYVNNFDLQYVKASLYVSASDYENAKLVAYQLKEANPDNTEVLMLLATIAKATDSKAEKTTILKEILAKDPQHSGANTELGHEQMLKSNFKLANRYYLTALAGDSTNLDALAGYGQSSYYIDNLEEAKASFLKMLEIDETNAFAWAYLGKLEAEVPDYKQALEYVEKAITYEPNYYDYWLDYGTYLQNCNRQEEAVTAWSKAIELRPDYFLGYVYRGGLYDELNMVEEAFADYKMVNQLYPEYYFAYESLGILAWVNGDYAASRDGFSKAYEIYPASTSYPMMIAASYYMEAYEKQGTPEEATLKKAGKDYISKVVLKKLDRNSTEYAIARLFYDNVAPGSVAQKVENETNANKRGKYLFYLAMYYQIRGNDNIAQKYYITVQEMQTPMFFEYRLNDWAIEKYRAAGKLF
jgi:tetratricopeptide (TPR) repeat protein